MTSRMEEIRKRAEKATKGPWAQSHRERKDGMYSTEVYDDQGETIAVMAWHCVPISNGMATDRQQNAEFIAHAREDIPFLLAELKIQDEANEILQRRLEEAENPYRAIETGCGHSRHLWVGSDPMCVACKLEKVESANAALVRENLEAWRTAGQLRIKLNEPESANASLVRELEKARDMIEIILPMAKGYAYANQVGANMKKIQAAEELLQPSPAVGDESSPMTDKELDDALKPPQGKTV